ncbi:50S ribosomal protein L30 [Methanobacterium sp. SMA-27]|uniref:50S ribosomal protein L30 n=1 Tax=Methanobacterium sp. SMA-27 TaxID=1495336 RepID=UPI00064E810B|nr:50S ribosomal protein L30 [Methanobacterium sp. SMA-27]
MIAVVRVRGRTGVKKGIQDTMSMLKLTRINHLVLLHEDPTYKGMLVKAKDYITWGEIDEETITQIITKRGKLSGNVNVTEEYIKENTDFSSIEELAKAVVAGEATVEDAGIKSVFRLHPPRRGYEATKKSFKEGGSLGNRGNINELVAKMI